LLSPEEAEAVELAEGRSFAAGTMTQEAGARTSCRGLTWWLDPSRSYFVTLVNINFGKSSLGE
jgi:hypothetical protein